MNKKIKLLGLILFATLTMGAIAFANSLIAPEKAIEIALEKVPGATSSHVVELHKDTEHGHLIYEGEIIYNGVEYEFDIDAKTGQILKWDEDRY